MQNYDIVAQIPNKIPLKISMDSGKVRIPLSEVELIGDNLGKIHTVVNKETGESFDDFKKNSEKYNYKGVSVHWRLEDQYDKGIVKEYLVILINSKIFRGLKYFEGITNDNSKLLYDSIIELGIAKFSYASFLKAQCTDIDFKRDDYCKLFGDVILQIKNISKPSALSNRGYNILDTRKKGILINQGIEFGKRKTASIGYPYLKFYHKFIELVYNSSEFYREYIEPLNLDIENLVRTEFTIKNKAHFLKYKIVDTSLENILNLDQSALESIMKDILRIHLDQRIKVIIPKLKLNIMDSFLLNAISAHIKNGLSFEQMCDNWIIPQTSVPRQEVRRFKIRLAKIYKAEIEGSLEDKKTIEIDSFFKTLGLS